MPDANQVVAEARRWIGVRWHHQGRSFEQGVDCIGLCLQVAENLELQVPKVSGYPRRQNGSELVSTMGNTLKPISRDGWQQGDIALFKDGGFPIHTGFLALNNGQVTVIHAHARRRKVVEEELETFGTPVAIYRLKEIA
ncbi:MAG: NlpC/P60 family protein [Sneathiella sp.]